MSAPAWFDSDYYMGEKLRALMKIDSSWTADKLYKAFNSSGFTNFYDHFKAYGDKENLNPNALFNENDYLRDKAIQMNMPGGGSTVADMIHAAGMTVAEHYDRYGFKEGINPSDNFDQGKYLQAKLYQVQSTDKGYTLDKLLRAFDAADLTPVEHYLKYAAQEGLTEAKANAAGYSYAVADKRPVVNPNKPSGFEYSIDYSSHKVRTVTIEKILTEHEENGAAHYFLTTTTVDLTQSTEITDVTVIGSTAMDLSGVLGLIGSR